MSTGIPTIYRNIRFRSRLEARWAAFFDKCGWKWDYEPIDLKVYIPDFFIHFEHGDLLVEIKPSRPSDDFETVGTKMELSGWRHAAAILCATWDERSTFSVRVGVGTPTLWYDYLQELREDGMSCRESWGNILLCECANCDGLALVHALDWPECLRCGSSERNSRDDVPPQSWVRLRVLPYYLIDLWWAEAGNEVQWKGNR